MNILPVATDEPACYEGVKYWVGQLLNHDVMGLPSPVQEVHEEHCNKVKNNLLYKQINNSHKIIFKKFRKIHQTFLELN